MIYLFLCNNLHFINYAEVCFQTFYGKLIHLMTASHRMNEDKFPRILFRIYRQAPASSP